MTSLPEKDEESTSGGHVDLIDFRLFERRPDGSVHEGVYGISVSRVREVAVLPRVEPVPDSHPAVEGLFPSRGEQVPVLRLSRWLRIVEAPPEGTVSKVIVCEVDGQVIGLLVHKASRIRTVPWALVRPPPPLVAQRHGATISATTTIENDRTMLVIDIEAIVAGVLGGAEETSDPPETWTGATIMVTDDSSTVRTRMRQILQSAGHRVVETEDGHAALQSLQSGNGIDLLITDVEMPRLSGLELTRALRADPTWSALPIIMQSSLAGEENLRRGREAGCDEYLVKFDAELLLQTVARLLQAQA